MQRVSCYKVTAAAISVSLQRGILQEGKITLNAGNSSNKSQLIEQIKNRTDVLSPTSLTKLPFIQYWYVSKRFGAIDKQTVVFRSVKPEFVCLKDSAVTNWDYSADSEETVKYVCFKNRNSLPHWKKGWSRGGLLETLPLSLFSVVVVK